MRIQKKVDAPKTVFVIAAEQVISLTAAMLAMRAVLSVTGLLLTEMLMWVGVERLEFHYMFAKVAVTGIVMVYNFVTRKVFLEERTER